MHIDFYTKIKTSTLVIGGEMYYVEIHKTEHDSLIVYQIYTPNQTIIFFTFKDVKSGALREKCKNWVPAIDKLNDRDYQVFIEKFRKEFGEK